MSFGGSGGGGGSISGSSDVALSAPSNGQVLTYNSGLTLWQNQTVTGSVGSATPLALGSATAGSSTSAARQDHVHPTTGLMLTSQQTSLKAVNIYASGSYPARPSGYGSVEWIGPVDPGVSALNNDTWINTA
jgi:hypothetical protein